MCEIPVSENKTYQDLALSKRFIPHRLQCRRQHRTLGVAIKHLGKGQARPEGAKFLNAEISNTRSRAHCGFFNHPRAIGNNSVDLLQFRCIFAPRKTIAYDSLRLSPPDLMCPKDAGLSAW
jgi:hypothetical protein